MEYGPGDLVEEYGSIEYGPGDLVEEYTGV